MKPRAAFKLVRTAILAAGLALPLSACESFDLTNLIPDSKKKLPGERREVFPEGVPGVSKGVPPELTKGYQAPPEERHRRGAAAGAVGTKTRAETGREAEAKTAAEADADRGAGISAAGSGAAGQGQQGQWPAQQKPASQQSAWPASPQPGTFSR